MTTPADPALPPGGGAPAPVIPPPGQAPPPAGAPPGAPPPAGDGVEVKLSSTELAKRLEESRESARRAVYKKYGVDKAEDLDARMAELDKLKLEKLSVEERAAKELNDARAKAAAGEVHGATAQAAVDALYATLSETQRAAVDKQAPSSAADKLRLINLVRELSGTPAPPAAPPPGGVAPPAPANVTPPPGAPRPGTAKTKFDEFQALPAGSLRASAYYRQHAAEIEATRPA